MEEEKEHTGFWHGLHLSSAFWVQWNVLDVEVAWSSRKNLQDIYEQSAW